MELFMMSPMNVIGVELRLPRSLLLIKGNQNIIVRQTVDVQRTSLPLPFCQDSGSSRVLPL